MTLRELSSIEQAEATGRFSRGAITHLWAVRCEFIEGPYRLTIKGGSLVPGWVWRAAFALLIRIQPWRKHEILGLTQEGRMKTPIA